MPLIQFADKPEVIPGGQQEHGDSGHDQSRAEPQRDA